LMELRRGTRYPVQLECTLSPCFTPAASLPGWTVNMSNCGILVSLDAAERLPPTAGVGEYAQVALELTRGPYLRECWLDCMCRVVRVDEQAGAHLVALDVRRYHFRPSPQNASAGP
jgi:flavin reductase (DIM6/NTAB) family NADH-FMN oxidoreductase RutF